MQLVFKLIIFTVKTVFKVKNYSSLEYIKTIIVFYGAHLRCRTLSYLFNMYINTAISYWLVQKVNLLISVLRM